MKPEITDPNKAHQYFAEKLAYTTGPAELSSWLQEGEKITVVDVRRADAFAEGHIENAVSLPKEQWDSLEGLRRDQLNVVYCYSESCHLAAEAARLFAARGYPVMELQGGMKAWQDAKAGA